MTVYTIIPFISVSDFVFGKSQAQIKQTCGQPYTSLTDNIMQHVLETREGCELVYEGRKLAYVTLNKHVTPVVNGIEIYAEGSVQRLQEIDPDHLIGPKYMIFRALGLCIGGLSAKKIPEGRLVNVFPSAKLDFFEFFVTD